MEYKDTILIASKYCIFIQYNNIIFKIFKNTFQWMESISNSNSIINKTHILYLPINFTNFLGFFATGYEIENTDVPQLLFIVMGNESLSSVKVQSYRMNGYSLVTPAYGHFLLIST